MTSNHHLVGKFVSDFRSHFDQLPIEDISFPRGCNNLNKWANPSGIYTKGTPIHVRGALLYNHYNKKNKLTHKYPLIMDGEKLKFVLLKTPNIVQSNVIAFLSELPKEFDLHEQIDFDRQFEKSFVDPIELIMECIDWQVDRSYGTQRTLESLFG